MFVHQRYNPTMKRIMKTPTILLVLALFLQTACSTGQNNSNGHILTPEQVVQQLDKGGVTMLDVRTPEEWSEGIIEGAVLMNFYDDDFASQVEALDKDKPVIVTCKVGGRSAEAAAMLQKAGFKEVYDMGAGMDGWKDEQRPMVKPE